MSETSYKLTYFNARGIGESIRLLFKLAEVDFEDIRLDIDSNSDAEGDSFPVTALPALEIGDVVLTQSVLAGTEVALCRYLARSFGLTGENEIQAVTCDQIVEDLFALRSAVIMLVCEQTHDPDRHAEYLDKFILEIMPVFLTKLTKTLESNAESNFFVGASYTWADVFGAYTMEFIENVAGSEALKQALARFPKVQKHYDDVYALPQIQAWVEIRPSAENERDRMVQTLRKLMEETI